MLRDIKELKGKSMKEMSIHISRLQIDGSIEGRKEAQEPESSMDKGTGSRPLNSSNLRGGAFIGNCRSTDLRSTSWN